MQRQVRVGAQRQAAFGTAIRPGSAGRKASLAAAAGVLGALAASSCCIAPLVLFTLGIGGAWIGNLTALEPYQPIFLGIAVGSLATGYYLSYRRPMGACAEGGDCARPRSSRLVRPALWAATALVAAAMAFPYAAPMLLGV
jgi:mercuric ion transport protein